MRRNESEGNFISPTKKRVSFSFPTTIIGRYVNNQKKRVILRSDSESFLRKFCLRKIKSPERFLQRIKVKMPKKSTCLENAFKCLCRRSTTLLWKVFLWFRFLRRKVDTSPNRSTRPLKPPTFNPTNITTLKRRTRKLVLTAAREVEITFGVVYLFYYREPKILRSTSLPKTTTLHFSWI